MLDTLQANLAVQAITLALVILLSSAHRYGMHFITDLRRKRSFVAILAWATEILQITLALLYIRNAVIGVQSLAKALQGHNDFEAFLAPSSPADIAVRLASYYLSIGFVDAIDSWMHPSAQLSPHQLKPFMLTRSLFHPQRTWVIEPAPLPPMPPSWSKHTSTRITPPNSQLLPPRVQQASPTPTPRNQRLRVDQPREPQRGRARTRKTVTFAMPSSSTTAAAARERSPSSRRNSSRPRKPLTDQANERHAEAHATLPIPPNSGVGYVRSRVRALSGLDDDVEPLDLSR